MSNGVYHQRTMAPPKIFTLRKRSSMNTKLSFAFLVIVIALIATACVPVINGSSVPGNPIKPADNQTVALVPITGASAPVSAHAPLESRLWSGSIFMSDDGNPDYVQNTQTTTIQKSQTECMSEDSQPRPQSGCIE